MKKLVLLAAAVWLGVMGATAAQAVTLSNTQGGFSVSPFGTPDTQTYGQVFIAPQSGVLTSFTLWLDGPVGSLYGGLGTWNGGAGFALGNGSPTNLFQSASVPSVDGGPYTFTPNVSVVAGNQYVAYLSVFGDLNANAVTSMPVGENSPAQFLYFVYNNSSAPQNNSSWNYDFNLGDFVDGGDVQFSLTISSPVPEPSTWAMLVLGFAGIGFIAYRRTRNSKVLSAA